MEFFRAKIKLFKKTNPKHQVHTLKKPFALLLILSHLSAFVLSVGVGSISNVYAANQVVDTTKSPTTFIDTTANGVDLINIANPNSVGVSVNHYNKFNVGTQGAILNNSKVMGTSQLGGAVYGNPNLNQNADIILNEVGTTNRSVLNGALEVFGQNAAVVIANPNGFDCNGCSFINTSKLTMVSGQSQVSDGAITGFKINNDLTSNFVIGKLGLYANNTDKVNIISRAIALRGELQAKQDLALKQGNDYYNYITGEVSSDANASPVEFGIDVSHLSNISAGSIKLIVTEKGAGVNTMDSNIITDLSRLEITADGDLVLKANLSSQTDISLTSHSGDITQSGDIKAVQNIAINTNQTYQNEGKDTIAQANLDISANTLNNQGGQLAAGANLNITANTLNNTQNTTQTQGGLIYAKNQLHITAANQLLNDKSSIVAQGSILINDTNNNLNTNSNNSTNTNSNNGTNNNLNLVINNKSGVIKSDNNITINAKTLNNTAYHYDTKQDDSDGYYGYDVNEKVVKSDYVMDQTLVLEQDEPISTLGSRSSFISALKDITINVSDELFNSSSVISAKQNLSITANKLTNETDSVSTHEMYRLWGKKWVRSWKTCGWHNWTWGCTTHYEDKTDSWSDTRSELAYSKDKGTLSAAQNLTINANESITNGETIHSNEFLGQIATNYQDNHAVTEAIAKNGQFKINKPTKLQPYLMETRNQFVDIAQFKASQYLFARPNIRFLDPTMSNCPVSPRCSSLSI